MNSLAKHSTHIEYVTSVISPVLDYFSGVILSAGIEEQFIAAADLTFSDELLLEKFVMWNDERDDEVFLFHIRRFFEKKSERPHPLVERDLTFRRKDIESTIKESARNKKARMFGERLTSLAIKNGLVTNKDLAEFLGILEDEARRFKSGENCPQIKTLSKVSNKFGVAVDYLVGISEDPSF